VSYLAKVPQELSGLLNFESKSYCCQVTDKYILVFFLNLDPLTFISLLLLQSDSCFDKFLALLHRRKCNHNIPGLLAALGCYI
jgi:hypothetical protein